MDITGIIRNIMRDLRQKFTENLERDNGLYWDLSSSDDRIQDQSHWCGSRRWTSTRWFEYGDFHDQLIKKYLEIYADTDYVTNLHQKVALEWGCGGGANVRPLCRSFADVYGTEVSKATIDECERQISGLGYQNFHPVFFPSENPESVLNVIGGEAVDFILSVAVFQHFPSKDYSQQVLKIMSRLLKDKAFALIQVRYFDGSDKLRQKENDYARNVVYMTSFSAHEFTEQLTKAGLKVLCSERDIDSPDDCHDYYFIRK